MKRRSNVAPVRPCELFEYRVAESAAEKKPIMPRQLHFTGNSSRKSMPVKPPRFSTSGYVPPRSRISLSGRVSLSGKATGRVSISGKATHDVSVMDGVSLLGQTINESSDDVTIQVLKPVVASTSSEPVCPVSTSQVLKKSDEAITDNGPKKCNTSVSNKTFGSCIQSLSDLGETKIPKPKICTTEKTKRTSAELNSTAAFEEEEIAALTSTPHHNRKSKSIVPASSSTSVNAELAEQMKLFIMDQRSLMQAVKLSCQKTTSAMEQMNSVMSQMNILVEKLTLKVDSHSEFNNVLSKSEACQNDDKIALSDDKENVNVCAGNTRKSISMFSDMKSQFKCLKTPTTVRTRTLCETPNTVLSNTIHNQLESLYESSETDT